MEGLFISIFAEKLKEIAYLQSHNKQFLIYTNSNVIGMVFFPPSHFIPFIFPPVFSIVEGHTKPKPNSINTLASWPYKSQGLGLYS
jgi:hypothetical protein